MIGSMSRRGFLRGIGAGISMSYVLPATVFGASAPSKRHGHQ